MERMGQKDEREDRGGEWGLRKPRAVIGSNGSAPALSRLADYA